MCKRKLTIEQEIQLKEKYENLGKLVKANAKNLSNNIYSFVTVVDYSSSDSNANYYGVSGISHDNSGNTKLNFFSVTLSPNITGITTHTISINGENIITYSSRNLTINDSSFDFYIEE